MTKQQNKAYHQKNKKRISERKKIYYQENKKHILANHKKHASRNVANNRVRCHACIKSWEGYFPKKIPCQICNKILYFNIKSFTNSIHFDHRKGGKEKIKGHPSMFLYTRYRNEKNQKIWEKCDFGILCRKCNAHLPTKNRKQYLKKVIKYVFGKEAKINGKESV